METPLPPQQPQSTWDGQPTPTPNSPKNYAILRTNLLMFAIYMVLGFTLGRLVPGAAFLLTAWILHGIVLIGMGLGALLQKDRRAAAAQFFISAFCIFVIGFGVCAAMSASEFFY